MIYSLLTLAFIVLFLLGRHLRIKMLSFSKIYWSIVITLITHWNKIVLFIMIINLLVYNPVLCAVTSENVSEYVKQDQYYIQEEAERIGIWELIHRRVNDQDIGVWLEDTPHRTRGEEPLIDGNQTCEDAAYNQRDPLPQENASEEGNGNPFNLSDEQYEEIIKKTGAVADKAVSLLNKVYPAVLDPTLPQVTISDGILKNVVLTAVIESNRAEWTAKNMEEALDINSMAYAYIEVILQARELTDNTLEKDLYTHMATSFTLVNHVTVNTLKNPAEFDAQLSECFGGQFYDDLKKSFHED